MPSVLPFVRPMALDLRAVHAHVEHYLPVEQPRHAKRTRGVELSLRGPPGTSLPGTGLRLVFELVSRRNAGNQEV